MAQEEAGAGGLNDTSARSPAPGDVPCTVFSYAGASYPEHPIALTWEGRRVSVDRIARSWREPGRLIFIVSSGDGDTFRLTYTEAADSWTAARLPATTGH